MKYLWISVLFVASCLSLLGDQFTLTNGNVIEGTLAQANEEGIVIRREDGSFAERIHWIRFDQETLKRLARNPELEDYTYAYIELEPEEIALKLDIKIKQPPRLERPEEGVGFLAAFTTPVGLLVLGLLFAGNIFAAYEIAAYKGRPVALVCSLSAILPIIAPILFLSMPESDEGAYEEHEEEGYGEPAPVQAGAPAAKQPGGVGVPGGGGLSLAHQSAGPGATANANLEGQSWKRGEVEFNRRFFETTFSAFFRVVPSVEVKDLVLAVRTARKEFVAKRISRISSTEMHMVLTAGMEQAVKFGDINEVKVRHKDAKA